MAYTNITIAHGTQADCNEVALLYDALNAYLAAHTNYPGWKKGVYPNREDAQAGIDEGSLFVARQDGKIIGTFILRRQPEPAYALADWRCALTDSELLVLYTFALHPEHIYRGLGRQLLQYILSYARDSGAKAIRLDVYEGNTPAIRLYESLGFDYIASVDLGYSEYGLDSFRLYQKLL